MTRARPYTAKYFTLSYYNPQTGEYALGWDDGYLILFCVLLFTGLRAASMEYVLAPFAKAHGIKKRKDITRFSEQAWLLMYYMVFWTLGAVSGAMRLKSPSQVWLTRHRSTSMSHRPTTSTSSSSGHNGPIARLLPS